MSWFTSLQVPVQTVLVSATVSSLIAVFGWVISFRFAVRAQRLNLRNQILNTAREAVIAPLVAYRGWLSSINGFSVRLKVGIENERQLGVPMNVAELSKDALALFYSDVTTAWIFALEEYELVFPETREVRQWLQEQHVGKLNGMLNELFDAIRLDATRTTVLKRDYWGDVVGEQTAILEYLRVEIQNRSLGKLLGRTRPVPEPIVPGLSRLVMVDGMLKVVLSDEASARRGREIQGPIPAHLDPAVPKPAEPEKPKQ